MKNVTVVIPVYKDWTTLNLCIESLKKYLDARHKVLLVNDMSAEWKDLEDKIKSAIEGHSNFEYYKNAENMGFVKTCNRAIEELDETDNDIFLLNSDTQVTEGFMEELLRILYQAEKHGVVCPRSNNATLLTVPFHKNTTKTLEPAESYALYQKILPMLPEKQVIPTGVGFAFLIKRSLLKRFGALDEAYGKGYNEENDLCMRINQYGYSILMANRAFVYHYESKSFGAQKLELDAVNGATLLERYSYYPEIIQRYFKTEVNPVDYFADLMADDLYEKPRVLIDLYEIPSAFNGTAEYGLSILGAFYKLFKEKYDIHVLINHAAGEFFKLKEKYPKVYYPEDLGDHTFHIAYSPSQIFNIEHMFILNRACLKYIFCMQDIISIRSKYLVLRDYERMDIFKKSIRYCDALASISDFSLNDTIAYYSEEFESREIPTRVVYHGTSKPIDYKPEGKEKPIFEKYFMVFGNFYKHKFLKETLPVMKSSKHNFVVLGANRTGHLSDNVYGYQSGMLPDSLIDSLVYHSQGILFPSVYEGFGLPILNGIDYNKKMVINNNELNRELREYFGNFGHNNISMFDNVEEIEALLDAIDKDPEVVYDCGHKTIRTWEDSARETEAFLAETLKAPINVKLLNDRWETYKYLENVHRCYVSTGRVTGKVRKRFVWKDFKVNCMVKIKANHPILYKILKPVRDVFRKKED